MCVRACAKQSVNMLFYKGRTICFLFNLVSISQLTFVFKNFFKALFFVDCKKKKDVIIHSVFLADDDLPKKDGKRVHSHSMSTLGGLPILC